MSLVVDGRTYLDGVDLQASEFYDLLKQADKPTTTSAPSPERFLDAFRQASRVAESVLCITVSPRFSACYDAARLGQEQAREEMAGFPVEVLDSGSAAAGEALVAMEAIRAAESGETLEAVTEAAKKAAEGVSILAFLDTLYYLWKGGRVPGIAHLGTSLLDLKPLFEMRLGETKSLARPRTAKRAMRRLVELMRERTGDARVHVGVLHAAVPERAEELRAMVADEFDCAELFTTEFSSVMGAHTGPGLLGLAFRPD